jgi:predicted phosphodiesterase
MAKIAGVGPGDALCFGHTHLSWTRTVGGIHFVNTGSVGRPKDGDPRACYVLLSDDGAEVRTEVVRVAYDVARAAEAIRASELPDDFADYLITAGRPTAPAA